MTETILSFTQHLTGPTGYLLLGLFALIENVVPPIPGDTVTILGGYLAGIGQLNIIGVVTATTIGSFAGFMLMYGLGAHLGQTFFLNRKIHVFSRKYFDKAAAWFERFGYTVVLGNRFLAGTRSVISLFAGISGLHPARVALYSFVSCFVWNMLLVYAGCQAGRNWEMIIEILKKYNAVVIVLTVFVAVWLIKRMRKT
ncbi:MAG: DedA family protein [Deltaproteobacteria bacterium]|nr:DedA family protein [Deltaproteobacteria bacterium]